VRLAVEAKYVEFMLGNDNVAVVVKRPIIVNTGCGIRHRITWRSSFLLRGGVKLFPVQADADQIVEVGNKAYKARAWRRLKYATVVLADEVADTILTNVVRDEKGDIKVLPKPVKQYGKFIKLEEPELTADGYLVFEVNGGEAKLTNDDPTHILFIFEHSVGSRVYDADIKILPEDTAVFKDVTSCKTKSVALAVVIAEIGKTFTKCYNVAPYRHGDFQPYYRCYNIRATIPPVYEFLADTPAPEHVSAEPDTVI
jgi:hypothetical protein